MLLVEVMRAGSETTDAERHAVLRVLQQRFALADDEVARLVELAEHRAKHATKFQAFTSTRNERLEHAENVQVAEAN